jgi:hypothetical protein
MPRLACALFTNILLARSGLKLKQAKGDEVNGKPDQEEEKEVGRGGGGRPGDGVAEIRGAGTNLCCSVL